MSRKRKKSAKTRARKNSLRSLQYYINTAKKLGCINPEILAKMCGNGGVGQGHKMAIQKLNFVKMGNAFCPDRHKIKYAGRELKLAKAREWLDKHKIQYLNKAA